jgi:hypothetical protein
MTADLVAFLRARLDEDALWATEASRRGDSDAVPGGAHWQWEDADTDDVVIPEPGRDTYVDEDRGAVSLRSVEEFPTHSVGALPQFAISHAEEVPSAVGGHIVRHDPARVLAEITAKRAIVDAYLPPGGDPHPGLPCTDDIEGDPDGEQYADDGYEACARHIKASERLIRHDYVLRLLAVPYAGVDGYRPEWSPDA